MEFDKLADEEKVQSIVDILAKNGIESFVVNSGAEAKEKLYELIPEGSEIMEASSTTMDEIGVTKELLEGSRYKSLRKKIMGVNDKAERDAYRKSVLGHAYAIGSVHAVTEQGQLVVASASGSQIGSYAYGADHLVLVIGTQKVVKNLDSAFERIEKYIFPLEDARMKKTFGFGSVIAKILIISKEIVPGRTKVIFVKEKFGF